MSTESSAVLIYGAGGSARETAFLAEDCGLTVAAFIDDDEANWGTVLNGIQVVSLSEAVRRFGGAPVTISVGKPSLRQLLAAKAAEAGLQLLAELRHPSVIASRFVELGPGAVLCAGTILTTNIKIGAHAQINLACTISHDVVAGDFLTLTPGVHISGSVRFGDRVYVGTGATFVNGTEDKPLIIGDDAVIGAGACVVRNVAAGTTVVGVPARPLERS